tara:strand:- start:1616 stop:2014 length:399 start_codon:yes stop_codon:yes gene_type:complete
MKFYLIFILIPFLGYAQKADPLLIDIRPRVIDNAKVIVNIEITNHLNRPIDYLEGFLSEYSSKGDLLNEKRVVLLYSYEPVLQTGFSTIKTAKFDLGEEKPSNFEFNISKVKFFGESRVFAWHKKAGFIRID